MTLVIPRRFAGAYSQTMADGFDPARAGPPDWALDELADYIVDRHHRYAQGAAAAIRQSLARAAERWGQQHPGVFNVQALFDQAAALLESHMAKEEHLLFPAIRSLVESRRRLRRSVPGPFVTLLHPIRVMEGEHAELRRLMADLRRESHNYVAPPTADEAGRQCYRELARFHADLETHAQLEDDVLFPRALALEQHIA
jgi:regulator of cell morphogenesis and NO signaling